MTEPTHGTPTVPGNQPPPGPPNPYWPPPPAYSPPAYGPPAGPPVKPPKSKPTFWATPRGFLTAMAILIGGLVIIGGLATLLDGVGPPTAPRPAVFEVEVTSCVGEVGSLSTATIGFTITNTGKTARNAMVHIEYRDADGSRLDTDTSYVRDIRPGDTVRQDESTILNSAASGTLTCYITGVN